MPCFWNPTADLSRSSTARYIFTPAKLGVDGQVHGFFYGYGALAVMLVLFQARSHPCSYHPPHAHCKASLSWLSQALAGVNISWLLHPTAHAAFAVDSRLLPALGTSSLCAMHAALAQAFHGLAVTLVYKYADAIVKNFANSAVMAILVVLSAYLFNTVTSVSALSHERRVPCLLPAHVGPVEHFCCPHRLSTHLAKMVLSSRAVSILSRRGWRVGHHIRLHEHRSADVNTLLHSPQCWDY